MSAMDDDDREIAQLVRNCWNPATGVHVYGGVLAKLSELCARSFVATDGLELLRSGDEHERAHADIVRQSARCVDPLMGALDKAIREQAVKLGNVEHHDRQRAKFDHKRGACGIWRVYTMGDDGEISHARDCTEHEAALVDAGLWVAP